MKALGTLVAALAGALACGGLLFGLGLLLVRSTNVGGCRFCESPGWFVGVVAGGAGAGVGAWIGVRVLR